MTCKPTAAAFKFGMLAFLFLTALLADSFWGISSGFYGSTIGEITAVLSDDSSFHWAVKLGLVSYLIFFLILERRSKPHANWRPLASPDFWLCILVALVLLRYVFAEGTMSGSAQASVLLAGIVLAKAASAWVSREWKLRRVCGSEAEKEAANRSETLIGFLIALFAGAALLRSGMRTGFQYHGVSRWSGIWNNPNVYGLLMGTGLVLTVGSGIRKWRMAGDGWRKTLLLTGYVIAAIATGYGLFRSYSRGAWLGTACGLAYFLGASIAKLVFADGANLSAINSQAASKSSRWARRDILLLTVFVASLGLTMFWQFRFSELLPVQRAFSVTNVNDFSWRNRVAAWNGARQMMVDRPLIGFGWGHAQSAYEKKYFASQLDSSAAITMNDFLMLGISAGIPALVCFVAYVTVVYFRSSSGRNSFSLISTIYRSGSIVLLVGFWFDGGLFKLSITPVFWTLMELSRMECATVNASEGMPVRAAVRNPFKGTIWLRRGVCAFATFALLESAVYLGTPFLPVNDSTLIIARKWLVPPKEISDFDFLSVNPVWRGQKLKILLEHVDLANYNRQLSNWKLDDSIYREYVLTPTILPERDGQLDWRRGFWEYFYPGIRKSTRTEAAAQLVLSRLQQQLVISEKASLTIEEMWQRQTTDPRGFEVLCVAVFRSVGIPARLDGNGRAEFFSDGNWRAASFRAS